MSLTQRPRLLYFGVGDTAAGAAVIAQADNGADDNGGSYAALALTNSIVAAQPSQEILCFATYVTVRHRLDTAQVVTALLYVDERSEITATFTVPASTRTQVSRFEIGWVDAVRSGNAGVTQAPRGHRLRVGVQVPPLATDASLLEVDGVECEIEILAESISPANAS
jgi:hypothetical protein